MKTAKELCEIASNEAMLFQSEFENMMNILEVYAKQGNKSATFYKGCVSEFNQLFFSSVKTTILINRLKENGFKITFDKQINRREIDRTDIITYSSGNIYYKTIVKRYFWFWKKEYKVPDYFINEYDYVKIDFCCGEENNEA